MTASAADLNARVANYQRLRDFSALWPDISETDFLASQRLIARAAAAVLRGDRAALAPPLPPPPSAHAALGIAAYSSGMGALLGYWIEQGQLSAPDAIVALLREHLRHGRLRAAKLRSELDGLVAELASRGIPVTLLKGADTAYRYFPDAATRPMADLDLLVRPEHFTPARAVLAQLGFVEGGTNNLPHRSDWMRPDQSGTIRSLELDHQDNPWIVDLHTTLDRMPFPGLVIAFGEAQSSAAAHSVLRTPHSVLAQPQHLAFIACHTSHDLSEVQLVKLIEIIFVVRQDYRSPAWRGFAAYVARQGIERFVYGPLELAERLAPGTLDPAVLERLRAAMPRRVRAVVDATDVGVLVRLRPVRRRLLWASRPRDYVAYFTHLVWPRTPSGVPLGWREILAQQRARAGRVLRALKRRLPLG